MLVPDSAGEHRTDRLDTRLTQVNKTNYDQRSLENLPEAQASGGGVTVVAHIVTDHRIYQVVN